MDDVKYELLGLRGWLGFVFAVVSVLVAYVEYRSSEQHRKIERTLNYYSYFEDIKAHQTSFDLTQFWDTAAPALDAVLATTPKDQSKKIYEDFVVDLVQKHDARAKVLLMISFYNSLATCVTADLCDLLTALRFYGPDAKAFRNNYYYYVEAYKRQNDEIDLTRPLEGFVTDYKSLRQVDLTRTNLGTCRYLPDAFSGVANDLGVSC